MSSREEWHAERATGLGGSDAAAACGQSAWRTPLDLYMTKVGYLDGMGRGRDDETPDMRRGTLLEPVVLQLYTDETGVVVRKPTESIVSSQYPFMRANLDGITLDEKTGIEAKTSRWKVPPGTSDLRKRWGEPWTEEIPLEYYFQVQHYMVVSNLQVFHMPVLFGDFEFAVYEVPADREFQELLVEHEARFWAMVQARTPPDPVNDSDVSKRWPISHPRKRRKATREALEIGGHLLAVREYFKKLEAFKESLEAELKRLMEDSEELVAGEEVICSWRTSEAATRFDTKKFQAEQPALFAQYSYKSAPGRPFLFKEKAQCLTIMKPLLAENLLPDRKLLEGK